MADKLRNWIKTPMQLIVDEDLTPVDAITYALLLDRAAADLSVRVSQGKLADLIGVTRKTIICSLSRLERNGYLWRVTNSDGGKSLVYKLTEILTKKPKKDDKKSNFDADDYKWLINNFDD